MSAPRLLLTVLLLVCCCCVIGLAAEEQDCSSSTYDCEKNNPCDPLCEKGVYMYAGPWEGKYLVCSKSGTCQQEKCQPHTQWNQENQRCENEDGVEARCSYGKFNCDDKNPCNPSLCEDGLWVYPGTWHTTFVECGKHGVCIEGRCPPKTHWDQQDQQCEGDNGLEARCSYGVYDCTDKNPCDPDLCKEGLWFYPGNWPTKYVECEKHGKCTEKKCDPKHVWDQSEQQCVPEDEGPPEDRCQRATYDCVEAENPCDPSTCEPEVIYYPHHNAAQFIQCREPGICVVRNCAEGAEWNDEFKACVYV